MDRKHGGLSSKCAVLIPVSKSSDVFNKVLAPLQNAYLYSESKEAFRYTSAFLFNNPKLQETYNAFRANRREAGYSEEELKEGYGFLLFDDINKATELGKTGLLTGNSTCNILGDSSKGVYISKYSDCLAPDHWHCGKSGFIVIIRLTKGRIKKVQENYTQNCVAPSVGFDCHESKELHMASANTSSFLAYQRTQYYLYELLPGECSKTSLSPSPVCPFAIVPFLYDDANTTSTVGIGPISHQEQSEMDGNVLNNIVWSGQLHISSQIYNVWLKSRSGASIPVIPVKLPPVVKVNRAISMVTLRQFAPKAVFETEFSGEVSLDGISCSVYEFVPIEGEDPSLSLLIKELKDKDLGLTVCLNESGFLILLHSSNFATCTGNESSITEALQAMFLFPGSRAIQKDTKEEVEKSQISSDILHILPGLNYAEIEVQKNSIGQSEDMRGQFAQQIKNYAALIHSGLAATPSKDVGQLSQDYDESLTSLCSSPKWTNQWMRSYLSYPDSFQLPVYSVTELLAAGNKRTKEVHDEDGDHVCLSPLEQSPETVCSIGPEELLSESTASDVSSSLQKDGAKKDSETSSILNDPLSRNPTNELVVSITSAEGITTVMDKSLSGSNNVSTQDDEGQLSNTHLATNTVDNKTPENQNARKTLPRGRPKGKRKGPPAGEPLTAMSEKQDEGRPPSQSILISDPPKTEWKILASQGTVGKLTYKYKKVPRSPRLQEIAVKQNKQRMENDSSKRLDSGSVTRRMDRWVLRPVITECGRTLVPHGSLNIMLQKSKLGSTDREQCFKEMVIKEAFKLQKIDQDPVNTTNNANGGDECNNTEVVGSPPCETSSSPQHNSRGQPIGTPEFGDHSIVNISEADTSDGVPSSTADISSHLNKNEHFLCKFKKLFLRTKRNRTQLVLGDSVLSVDSSTEPSLKKSKSDMDSEILKSDSNADSQDSRERNKDVLRDFAQALGLMPKTVPDKMQETQNTDTPEKRLPLSLEAPSIPPVVESPQFIPRVPPPPIQEKLQVNRLLRKRKKRRAFHKPFSSTMERSKNKVCAKSHSFDHNQKELLCSTDQSSNALCLLADLALGGDQASPLLDPFLMTKLGQSLDVLPSTSPLPEGLVGSKDEIDLIAKEHDYTSYNTMQVLQKGSLEGMPQHGQNLFGPGLPALSNVPPEGSEPKASIEHMKKDEIPSRRFRRSRRFVEKDGMLKVTRKWKGNYDFDLDSKFTNHPVEKTVCRGLHGSWNFTVKDDGEEAQLVIHMWIGLFYSRSTPRFIHSSPLDLEDCLETSDEMTLSQTDHKTLSIGNSQAQDFEPIQEERLVFNQGSEVLDLSVKMQGENDGKKASEAFIREAGIQEEDPAQCQAKHQALQIYRPQPSEFGEDKNGTDHNIVQSRSEKADASITNLEHSAVNSLSEDKTCEGSNIEASEMGERNENLQNTEASIEMDASCETMHVDTNSPCTSLVGTEESDGNESNCEDHRNDAGSCLPLIDNEDSTTKHKSPVPYVNLPDNETQSVDITSITLPHGSNEYGNDDEYCQSASDQGHWTKEEDDSLKPKSVNDGHWTIQGDDPGVSCQSSPVRQPFEDGKKDASTDEMLPMQCANFNTSAGGGDDADDGVSVENSNIGLDLTLPEEHDDKESVDEAKIEIFGEQEKFTDSTPLHDGIVGESQAEVLSDVSVVGCDNQQQDDNLMENEVETGAQSPQGGVSKLLQDPSEKHLIGKDDSKQEVDVDSQVLPVQDNPVEVLHVPKEMTMNIDVYHTSQENSEKVLIAENAPLNFEGGDSEHKLGSDNSEVDRCPTSTKEDGPVVHCQASLVEQPCEGDGKKDASSEGMLKTQCASANASMSDSDDDTISEENWNIALDKMLPEEKDDNDSMDEANNEIRSDQNTSDNDSTPLEDGIVDESQAEVFSDVSVVSCDQETASITAPKAASHRHAHSSQDEVLKWLQDPGEKPIVGKDISEPQVEAGSQVLCVQNNPAEEVNERKEMEINIDVYHMALENSGKVQITENVLSVFEESNSKHGLESDDGEDDKRCPKPTKGDGPVVHSQAFLVEQPCEGGGKKDVSSDEMLQTKPANANAPMSGGCDDGDDTDDDSMDEANIETLSDQNTSDNDSTPLEDGIVDVSQEEVLSDVSVVSCDQEQDDELIENEVETASITAPKAASHHQAHSSQDEVLKLLQDPSEKPIVGKDISEPQVEAGSEALCVQNNPAEEVNERKEKAMNIDVYHMALENSGKVQITENVLLVFEESNSKHGLESDDGEDDKRCPKPTKGDGPVIHSQAFLVEQPCEGGGKKDVSSDEMLQTKPANANAPMSDGCDDGDDTDDDSMDEANIETLSDQNTSDNDSTPLEDGIVDVRQEEVLSDVSVVRCDPQEHDDELIESEVEAACMLAPKASSHHQAQSPKDGVPKLILNPSEKPLVGKDQSKQDVEAGPQVLPVQEHILEMVNEPKEMAINLNLSGNLLENSEKIQIAENVASVFEDSISEQKLDSETSELNERCPTPTIDEKPYEYIPSLEQSISNQACKSSAEKEHRTSSTHAHQWGKEVLLNAEPELKTVGGKNPARDLCEENPRTRLLETTDLPPSLNQSPTLCRKYMDMDSLNDKTSHVNGGMTPAKQSPLKRAMFSEEGWTLPVPCTPKKMKNNWEICEAPVQSRLAADSHSCSLCPVVVIKPLFTGSQSDDLYKENEMFNLALSSSDDDDDDDQTKIPIIPSTFKPSRTVPSIVSMQSGEGEQFHSDYYMGVTDEDILKMEPSTSSFKYTNYRFTKTVSNSLGQLTEACMDSDLTQFSMEQEFLIFSEEMKRLLSRRGPGKNPKHGSMDSYPSCDGPQPVLDLSIDGDMPESGMEETTGEDILYRHRFLSRRNCAEANVALSDIEAECARSYHTMMDGICAGKSYLSETDGGLRDHAGSSRQMRSAMFGSMNHDLNFVVRQSSKTKFRFYILTTSDDPFFEETKALLEADGHTDVQPSHFFPNDQSSSSSTSLLLIILRNEDIAEHIVKVPHLLELKKSANVLFAGIDQPDDIGNLTHQDLFKKGGFIMLEGTALEDLSFCKMTGLLDFLQELSKNGKWKWILHYRDSRRLKENARFSAEEAEKKHLMKRFQETGIVEVLPYHECDQLCREEPSYLSCLLQLQVHNITARFPVFVTNTTATMEDSAFGRHGILTVNINSLLTVIESEKCTLGTII